MNAPTRTAEASALAASVAAYADEAWDQRIVPALTDYIAVPAKSPMFDAQWAEHGLLERVVTDAARWVESRRVAGLQLEVIRLPGRTPVLFFDIPATRAGSTETDRPAAGMSAVLMRHHRRLSTWASRYK
jgi:hypothetical protein